jgi:hypothetical protein
MKPVSGGVQGKNMIYVITTPNPLRLIQVGPGALNGNALSVALNGMMMMAETTITV